MTLEECEELLAQLQGLPGLRLREGASANDVFAAQDAIGVKFPPDLCMLWLASDGLSVDHGLLRYLPVARSDPLNIARFNDAATWKWAFAQSNPSVLDYVFVAVFWTGSVLGFRRADLDGMDRQSTRTYVVVPRATGGIFPAGTTVCGGLRRRTEALRQTGNLSLHPEDQAVIDKHGPLPPGKIVMPGARDLIEDDGSLEGSYPMETVSALIAIGDLTTQLREMPEGTEVLAVEPWVDELGRTRLRWRTKQPR